jgi:hypothetical protein
VAAHGTPLIVTAEVETHLGAMRSQTGYNGEAIVDPENLLAEDLKRRGLLDVAISDKSGYEHGMAQPAVLVMKKDGTVIYQWAIVPSLVRSLQLIGEEGNRCSLVMQMNVGGATDRPSLVQIWENAQAQMNEKPAVHKTYSTMKFWQGLKLKIFG